MARSLGGASPSVLSLTAVAYGQRPGDEATVPTGFDPSACVLFEALVEGGYLVACADGEFDADERRTFERVVTDVCSGAVPPPAVEALVADLQTQLSEDGIDKRIAAVAANVTRKEHAHEVLRVAVLLAQASHDVSSEERAVLAKLGAALGLATSEVEEALSDVQRGLAAAS
jgi:tellurite resistance protein